MITGNTNEIGLKWAMKQEKVPSQWALFMEEERKRINTKKGQKYPAVKYFNDEN